MHFKYRNVNEAFLKLISGIFTGEIPTVVTSSRAGEVAMIEEPVTVSYLRPRERVLLNEARDANPFFHLYESLWMLAGRNDLAPLTYYLSSYADFSDDGETVNGAYGYRWRHSALSAANPCLDNPLGEGVDQLKLIIEHLRAKPNSRRAVLSMWNIEDDLLKVDSSKDVCCNTHAYFSVETGDCLACGGTGTDVKVRVEGYPNAGRQCETCKGMPHEVPRYLNITVCNRSNDLVWGMLGANVVHFSILLEYLAAHLGLEVGTYNQFTNNLHVYTERWEPRKWVVDQEKKRTMHDPKPFSYEESPMTLVPLVKNPEKFDEELLDFVERHSGDRRGRAYSEPFLRTVAQPMMSAYRHHKRRDYSNALITAGIIESDDWKTAAIRWLERRQRRWEST